MLQPAILYEEKIRWADYCHHWDNFICSLYNTKCPFSDLGGYPINQECQFYENEHKNLTNSVKYDII